MNSSRSVPFGRPWLTDDDRKAVAEVLDGPILTHGPQGEAFEEEFAAFAGDGHCVALSSCMAALHLAWLALGVGPGDEVIVAAQTHVATAHAVEWVGARPVFVDCDPRTGNVRASDIEAAITPRTKGVGLVHFLGIPCEMPAIAALCGSRGLALVEDCALAVGARVSGTHVGLFGDAGCFSFYPVKHLTSGEGGMLITRRADMAERVRAMRGFGVDRSHAARGASGAYDVPVLGLNYRMSELHAALGRSQLRRIDENLARRERAFVRLAGVVAEGGEGAVLLDDGRPGMGSARYCLGVQFTGAAAARRDEASALARSAGVGTSVYYPHPVPRMAYYRGRYGFDETGFPGASAISDASLCFPVGPHLSDEDLDHVAGVLSSVIREVAVG